MSYNKIAAFSFSFAVVGAIFFAISYTLPTILSTSFFEPAPRVEYALAIVKMLDPVQEDSAACLMDALHLSPTFPWYSRESDNVTAWPPRVMRDNDELFSIYTEVLKRYDLDNRAAEKVPNDIAIQGVAESASLSLVANLRYWFNCTLQGDVAALAQAIGADALQAFLKAEQARSSLRENFPNRLALLRIKNIGKKDALDLTIELEIHGIVYDHTISTDAEQAREVEYDLANKRIVVKQILPGKLMEIRLWYKYYPVEERVSPDEKDYISELTQGLVINNIAINGGVVAFNGDILQTFSANEVKYIGSAERKDDYSKELKAYFDHQEALAEEANKRYEDEHPTLRNVLPEQLATSERPDDSVNAIWIAFTSTTGRSYKAVHVFKHPQGPYILLISKDKDSNDFSRVSAQLAQAYAGDAEEEITDRDDDICRVIQVKSGFTQKGVAEKVTNWFIKNFNDVTIEEVYY